MDLLQQVADMISRVVLESTGREVQVSEDDRIIESGLLDSLSMVSLVLRLKEEFNIDIDFSDLDEETFGSPRSIAALVRVRSEGTSAG